MLIHHQVLQHGVLVLNLIVYFLVKEAHSIVWVLCAKIIRDWAPLFFQEDIR